MSPVGEVIKATLTELIRLEAKHRDSACASLWCRPTPAPRSSSPNFSLRGKSTS